MPKSVVPTAPVPLSPMCARLQTGWMARRAQGRACLTSRRALSSPRAQRSYTHRSASVSHLISPRPVFLGAVSALFVSCDFFKISPPLFLLAVARSSAVLPASTFSNPPWSTRVCYTSPDPRQLRHHSQQRRPRCLDLVRSPGSAVLAGPRWPTLVAQYKKPSPGLPRVVNPPATAGRYQQ